MEKIYTKKICIQKIKYIERYYNKIKMFKFDKKYVISKIKNNF